MATKRSWGTRIARALLVVMVALATLLALPLVALKTSWARERVRHLINSALEDTFRGKLVMERIGGIDLGGVHGVDAYMLDPAERRVITLRGGSASAFLPELAWSLLIDDAPHLALRAVHVDHAEVRLRPDEEATVTLASAFQPREPEPLPAREPAPSLSLEISEIAIDHLWTHGQVEGSPWLDAELASSRAKLALNPDAFELTLLGSRLTTRGLPLAIDPRGRLEGKLNVPTDELAPLKALLQLEGRATSSPLSLEASLWGDRVEARLSLPSVPASVLKQHLPELEPQGDLQLSAEIRGELPSLDFQLELLSSAGRAQASGYVFVSPPLEAVARLEVTGLELDGVLPEAPSTQLDFSARALLFERAAGDLVGAHRVDIASGSWAGVPTPGAWIDGNFALSSEGRLTVRGELRIEEPGAPTSGRYALELPSSAGGRIELHVRSLLSQPQRLADLGVLARGTLQLDAAFEPESETLSVVTDLRLAALEYRQLRATYVVATARARGTLADPRLQAQVELALLDGRARAALDHDGARQSLDVSAQDIDLPSLVSTLGLPVQIQSGVLGLEAEVRRRHGRWSGTLDTSVARLDLENVRGADLRARGRLDDEILDGTLQVGLGQLGSLQLVASDLEVPRDPSDLRELERLRGQLLVSGRLELDELAPLLARAGLPVERAAGLLRFEAQLRNQPDELGPELALLLTTNGLRIVEKRRAATEADTTAAATEQQPFALDGIDARLSTHLRPKQGAAFGTLILRDRGGLLANAQFELQLPETWRRSLEQPRLLYQAPLKVRLQTPPRRLSSLPNLLRPAGMRGRVALVALLDGSLAEPLIRAQASASRLRSLERMQPVNLDLEVAITPTWGQLGVLANASRGGRTVADLAVYWHGDVRRLPAQLRGERVLHAEAAATLSGFPLELVPGLAVRQIQGYVSGVARLENWGRDARLEARLTSQAVRIGQIPVERLELEAQAEQGTVTAAVDVEAGGSRSRVTLDADMKWGARASPQLGARGVIEASARAFRLETLMPLVGAYVSELSGRLDAQARLELAPGSSELEAEASLTEGVLQIPVIGQRLSGIDARLSVEDDQVLLERLDARGMTGRISARGRARLDGFALASASAQVRIDENQMIPITVEGVAIGDAWGNLELAYRDTAARERRLEVTVPEFHLQTPDLDPHGLQSLEDAEDVLIGYRRADGEFVTLPVQPLEPGGEATAEEQDAGPPLVVHVVLGDNVTVQRAETAHVRLTGDLEIVSGETLRATGRIELRGGELDVQGKTFEIERGVLTFDGGEPSNPIITATARWDAPEYTVYAEYAGTLEDGRLRLRSEPPLTQDELTSLLLFGTPEGSLGGEASAAAVAVGVAGGPATKGLNRALSGLTNLDVTARIDTSTGSARPELVMQLSPRLTARVTRSIGQPAVGERPDRTFLTLELRLRRSWALSAVLGDRGASALDLIWRKRY